MADNSTHEMIPPRQDETWQRGVFTAGPPKLHVRYWPNPIGQKPEDALGRLLKAGDEVFLVVGVEGDDLVLEPKQ